MRKQTSQFPNPKKRPTIILMQNGMYEKKGHKFDIYVINKSTKSKCQIPLGELSLKKKDEKKKSSPNSQTTHKEGGGMRKLITSVCQIHHIDAKGIKYIIHMDVTTV